MLLRRALASIVLVLCAITVGGGSTLTAQLPTDSSNPPTGATNLPTGGTNLFVPISGVADLGGTFRGTMLISQFTPAANGVGAIGTVTGALTANGTVRNLVMQVVLPVDIAASRARTSTDAALAKASCDVLHVELGAASINVLGSTMGLKPVAFDIVSALQAGTAPAAVSTAVQSATVTPSPSANTTQPPTTSSAPGLVPRATTPPPAQMSLGSLLCSVDRFRNVGSPAQLAQQLNAILTALGTTPLGTTQGS
jgi:hypothetical protein